MATIEKVAPAGPALASPADAPRKRSRRLAAAATFALYLALAVAVFGSTWVHPAAAWIGDDRDPHLFLWYLGWTPARLQLLRDPLFTTVLNHPAGANLMWNTSIVAPAAVLWPVTAAFGPVVAYNVMVTLAVALSAWFAYLAVRRFVDSAPFAAVAGLVYGFSPFMLAQSTRHPHVVIAIFPPLVLLLLHDLLTGRRGRGLLLGALLGAAGAIQLLTGEELLATTALVAAIATALLALLRPRAVAGAARRCAPALLAALVVFAILAAYPLAFQLGGPQRAAGVLQTQNRYVTDLLASVVPPGSLLLSTPATASVAGAFTGNASENGAYLGLPLLGLLAAAAVIRWRRLEVRWAVLTIVVLAVLALGPRLHVGGVVTALRLPWALIGGGGPLASALPGRLMLFVYLGVALIVADLGAAIAAGGGRRALLAGTLVALALVPLLPRLPFPSTSSSAPGFFAAAGTGSRSLGGSVLVTPFSNNHSSTAMYWQALAGYRFSMPEGEVFVPGPVLGPPGTLIQWTLDGLDRGGPERTSPAELAQARSELRRMGVSTVVAGPSPGHDRIADYLTLVLGRPPERTEGVDVWWNVQSDLGPAAG